MLGKEQLKKKVWICWVFLGNIRDVACKVLFVGVCLIICMCDVIGWKLFETNSGTKIWNIENKYDKNGYNGKLVMQGEQTRNMLIYGYQQTHNYYLFGHMCGNPL